MAVAEKTLLEFLMDLLSNHEALADFRDNPEAALQHAGLGDVCVNDIKELLPVVLEKVDAEKCAQYEDDCDDDKCYDSEPKHHDDDHHCKPVDCDEDGRPAAHCSPIEQSIAHLNYVTNNYNFVDNSHNTYNETNNITKIWAGDDADINVHNDTTNVGEHGAYVGGDSNAPIVTGDGSFVGDGNNVAGQGSHAAFGGGSVYDTGDIDAGDHGGINFGSGTNTVTDASTNDSGNTTTKDSNNDNSHGSHNSSVDASTTQHDVGNTDVDNSTAIHDNELKLASDNHLTDDHSQTVDHGHIDNGVPIFG